MNNDRIDPEPAIARAPGGGWDLGEILGMGLILAAALLAVAYVAEGILEAGATPNQYQLQISLLYSTQWITPYVVLFPLAALVLGWFRLRRLPASPAASGSPGTGESDGAASAHRLRARRLAFGSGVAFVVFACAAIGSVVASLMLFHLSQLAGNQVWPQLSQTLGEASSALVLCVIGSGGAYYLRRQASSPAGDEAEEESGDEAEEAAELEAAAVID